MSAKQCALSSLTVIVLGSIPAAAHVPFVEPQTLARHPWRYVCELDDDTLALIEQENGPDTPLEFSFETPFVIGPQLQAANPIPSECRDDPADEYTLPPLTVEDSQAVQAYLTRGDVDVFKFTVTFEDVIGGPVIVSASALPPACRQTRNNYPVTALIGPGFVTFPPPFGTADDPTIPLPGDVQEFLDGNPGYQILVANNPRIPRWQPRPIFDTDAADPESGLGLSWFLPEGLSLECLFDPAVQCDFSNTITTGVVIPGDYYIVMWDPRGRKQDYTANIGFLEAVTECYLDNGNRDVILGLSANNGLLHRPCREPRR
jgi:hypothetical protein